MPLHTQLDISPNHKVAVWQINEGLDYFLAGLELSDGDKAMLDSFRLEKRKKEWLVSRMLLKSLLGFYPEIAYDANGKPQLSNGDVYISISHTDGFAAVSVSEKPTALDIELCQSRVEKVAQRFVHADEEAYIEPNRRKQYLTVLWSAKETLYKYYNIFGVIFKEQFLVHPFCLAAAGHLKCEFNCEGETERLNLRYLVHDRYTLVYC